MNEEREWKEPVIDGEDDFDFVYRYGTELMMSGLDN